MKHALIRFLFPVFSLFLIQITFHTYLAFGAARSLPSIFSAGDELVRQGKFTDAMQAYERVIQGPLDDTIALMDAHADGFAKKFDKHVKQLGPAADLRIKLASLLDTAARRQTHRKINAVETHLYRHSGQLPEDVVEIFQGRIGELRRGVEKPLTYQDSVVSKPIGLSVRKEHTRNFYQQLDAIEAALKRKDGSAEAHRVLSQVKADAQFLQLQEQTADTLSVLEQRIKSLRRNTVLNL